MFDVRSPWHGLLLMLRNSSALRSYARHNRHKWLQHHPASLHIRKQKCHALKIVKKYEFSGSPGKAIYFWTGDGGSIRWTGGKASLKLQSTVEKWPWLWPWCREHVTLTVTLALLLVLRTSSQVLEERETARSLQSNPWSGETRNCKGPHTINAANVCLGSLFQALVPNCNYRESLEQAIV